MSLQERIRNASEKDIKSGHILTEICQVLEAIRELTKTYPSISKELPFKLTASNNRARVVIDKLKSGSKGRDNDKEENDKIIAFVDAVKKGDVEFWNPITPFRYDLEQSKFLANRGYYCIALAFFLRDTDLHHRILRRFTYRVVHGLTLNGGRTAQSISKDLIQNGIADGKSYEELVQELTDFVNAGRRYYDLAKLCGDGILFFLPDHQQFWEKYLPKGGELYEETIGILKDNGVTARSEPYNQLARSLIKKGADVAIVSTHDVPWTQVVVSTDTLNRPPHSSHESTAKRPNNSRPPTGKRQKTRDGRESFELDDVLNRPQAEQHNISERPNTLPDEQARGAVPAVDADNHKSPAPQTSGQDGPEYSRSPSLLSPTAIDISPTGFIDGSEDRPISIESTRYSSLPNGQTINNEPIAVTFTPTENAVSSTVSIDNSFTVEYQQRQYNGNIRWAEQSSSDLHTAVEGEHQNNSNPSPEDIEQSCHGQSRSIDSWLPSYGLGNVFPELDDELFSVT